MADLADVVEAWEWLYNHPAFSFKGVSSKSVSQQIWGTPYREPGFDRALDIAYVKVNPQTEHIEAAGNTATRVWLEAGPWLDPEVSDGPYAGAVHFTNCPEMWTDSEWYRETGVPSHDIKLDVGAPTFEEALLKLAQKVREHYGDY